MIPVSKFLDPANCEYIEIVRYKMWLRDYLLYIYYLGCLNHQHLKDFLNSEISPDMSATVFFVKFDSLCHHS